MKTKQILFTAPNTAELTEKDLQEPARNEVLVRTAYTAISAGTERANITGHKNVNGSIVDMPVTFPRACGYSGSGIVEKMGEDVIGFKPGDRVATCWGVHSQYQVISEDRVIKINHDNITLSEACMSLIASFSMAGVRKTRLEFGESAMVMGSGILGIFAIQILRAAGAVPIIAADPIEEKRKFALELGADYAFDSMQPDFVENVKRVTGGKGVNAAVEVSGFGTALIQALECMSPLGRISLLGCTRDSDFNVDYYHRVHFPGVSLIGAHTMARPKYESSPHNWTTKDDITALLNLEACGRISLKKMINEIHSPNEYKEVYKRLIHDKKFPAGVLFNWEELK